MFSRSPATRSAEAPRQTLGRVLFLWLSFMPALALPLLSQQPKIVTAAVAALVLVVVCTVVVVVRRETFSRWMVVVLGLAGVAGMGIFVMAAYGAYVG